MKILLRLIVSHYTRFVVGVFLLVLISYCSVSQAHVLNGSKEQNGHYYKIFEFPLTWENAKSFCESMGGHLVTIEYDDEKGIIRRILLDGIQESYWLGCYRYSGSLFTWVDGQQIGLNIPDWSSNEPSPKYDYVFLNRSSVRWYTGDNSYEIAFICEWDSRDSAHDSDL